MFGLRDEVVFAVVELEIDKLVDFVGIFVADVVEGVEEVGVGLEFWVPVFGW
jgi:uncharacterized membrane protein